MVMVRYSEWSSRVAVRYGGREVTYGRLWELVEGFRDRGPVVAVDGDDRFECVVGLLAAAEFGWLYAPGGGVSGSEAGGYLIRTSGTTGVPKSVRVSWPVLVGHVKAVRERFGIRADDVVLQFARPGVDVAIEQVLVALSAGATLVLPPRRLMSAGEFLDLLDAERVTVANLPAGYFHEVAAELGRTPRTPVALRTMISGSDRLHPRAARTWREVTGVRLLNAYGPTEAVITTSVQSVIDDTITLGEPVGDRVHHVLDERLRPCDEGELYIGGSTLADGYDGGSGRTADRFIADPFADGGRMYRTGDVVRRTPAGLEFLGRHDHQVKIRGYRVELGEVEEAVASCPGVENSAAVVRDGALAAYVTGADLNADVILGHVSRGYPAQLVPATVTVLDALPLTPDGSVDRAALPEARRTGGAQPLTTDAEQRVARIWSDVLGVADIGARDNFFGLGGDSLTAVQVAGRIFEDFGPISPHVVFEAPTLAELAAQVAGGSAQVEQELVRRDLDRAPLSAFQRGLWLLDCWNPGTSLYCVPWVFTFTDPVDPAVLRQALETIVGRHEVLRATVVAEELEPELVVHDHVDLPFTVTDVPEDDLAQRIAEAAEQPFDLETGPLVRAHVLRTPGRGTRLVLVFHHIIWDEASVRVLERELRELCAGRTELPEPAIRYTDYCAWLADTGTSDEDRDYWREQLRDAPDVQALTPDHPRPDEPTHRGDRHEFAVTPEVARAVRELARAEGVTPYSVLLAGLVSVLHRAEGNDDFVLGTPVDLRDRPELAGLIGYFVNVLPLRFRLGAGTSFRELVRHVGEVVVGAQKHRGVPFDEITGLVLDERPTDRNPLFQLSFALHVADGGDPAALEHELHVNPVSRFDAAWSIADDGTGFGCRVEYATDLFERGTIVALGADWLRELAHATREPDRPVDAATTMTGLFGQRAAEAPDRIAVAHRGQALTYEELDHRANRLAHRLIESGVRPGDAVAVLLRHGTDMVVATLAVVKADGAYVPLSESLPATRLRTIMTETGAAVLLTGLPDHPAVLAEHAHGTRVVRVTDLSPTTTAPRVRVHPDSTAYITFTSGSTGRPKGVVISHRNVLEMVRDACWDTGRQERVLLHSAYAFDATTYEIWLPLLSGTSIVVAESDDGADVADLARVIVERGVTAAYFTSALFSLMAEECLDALGALREVWTGGDVVSATAVQRVLLRCPDTTLVHVYGPTETTLWCSSQTFGPDDRTPARLTLGLPMTNTAMYLLDDRLRPVEPGGTGEVYVAGPRLAHGYTGRGGLTGERFLPDPFGPPGERMYRTGDLARRTSRGAFEFVGRADDQVKIRGFRIEPAEVQHAIESHPAVTGCAVTVQGTGQRHLAAYLTSGANPPPTAAQVHEFLADLLPEYMIPSTVTVLDSLPLTGNGKVDRAALPAAAAPAPAEPSGSDTERLVAKVLAEVLGLGAVGHDDNFFRLGGNSLAAVQVAMRLSKQIGSRVPPRLVFTAKTARGLAQELTGEQR